jgi:hypothetical protein
LDARIEGSPLAALDMPGTSPQEAAATPHVTRPGRPNWRLGETIRLAEWQAYYRASEVFPSPPSPRSAAQDVLQALSRYEAELAELQAASARPYARFNLRYEEENPFAMLLPHLSALRNIGRVLQLRAVAHLEAGEARAALEDVELMLTLADSIREEPVLISHLVRLALLDLTDQALWEGLNRQVWSEEQLARLQERLSEADLIAELKQAFVGERAFGTGALELMVRSPAVALQITDGGGSPGPAIRLVPKGWFYFEMVNYNRFFDRYLLETLPDTVGELEVAEVKRAGVEFEQELSGISTIQAVLEHRLFTRLLVPALNKVPIKSAQGEASRAMAVTAIALERHRLDRGTYPESLSALTPQWLAAVPNDPLTQQPLRYERDGADSFRLWSVGWNEKDDGGEVVVKRSDGLEVLVAEEGDWVWPRPEGMRIGAHRE